MQTSKVTYWRYAIHYVSSLRSKVKEQMNVTKTLQQITNKQIGPLYILTFISFAMDIKGDIKTPHSRMTKTCWKTLVTCLWNKCDKSQKAIGTICWGYLSTMQCIVKGPSQLRMWNVFKATNGYWSLQVVLSTFVNICGWGEGILESPLKVGPLYTLTNIICHRYYGSRHVMSFILIQLYRGLCLYLLIQVFRKCSTIEYWNVHGKYKNSLTAAHIFISEPQLWCYIFLPFRYLIINSGRNLWLGMLILFFITCSISEG